MIFNKKCIIGLLLIQIFILYLFFYKLNNKLVSNSSNLNNNINNDFIENYTSCVCTDERGFPKDINSIFCGPDGLINVFKGS